MLIIYYIIRCLFRISIQILAKSFIWINQLQELKNSIHWPLPKVFHKNSNAVPNSSNLESQNQPVQNYCCIEICQQNPQKNDIFLSSSESADNQQQSSGFSFSNISTGYDRIFFSYSNICRKLKLPVLLLVLTVM